MQNAAALLSLLADVTANRDALAAELQRVGQGCLEILKDAPEGASLTPQSDVIGLLKAHVLRLRSELEAVKGPPKDLPEGALSPEAASQ